MKLICQHIFLFTTILADIERDNDGFTGMFTVTKKGRLYHTIEVIQNKLNLPYCLYACIQHLQCKTVNYNQQLQLCELTNMDYDEYEADENPLHDWWNYGTPPKQKIEEWEEINLIEDEREIKHDALVTTIPKLTKEYKISLELMVTSIFGEWRNVIHFTTGGNIDQYGNLTPAIYIRQGFIRILSAVNGNVKYGYPVNVASSIKIGEWTRIEINQIKGNDGYSYTVIINGKQEHTIINVQPEAFYNVKCYVSNPWLIAEVGAVRNLYVYTKYN